MESAGRPKVFIVATVSRAKGPGSCEKIIAFPTNGPSDCPMPLKRDFVESTDQMHCPESRLKPECRDNDRRRSAVMGCRHGQAVNTSLHQDGSPKPPETLSTLERLALATGGTEKSWNRCIFPFGIISLVIGIAGTGVTFYFNNMQLSKVLAYMGLGLGLGSLSLIVRRAKFTKKVVTLARIVHCRCSSCYPAPTKRRVKKRIPVKTLLTLPEDVLLYILQCLSAEDLPSVRLVHSRLRDLIDSHTSVWARARFQDVWPSPENIWIFERAAHSGNFGAAVKLGIAYLYNEGPSVSDEGRAEVCGEKASHYFSLAESLRIPPEPFTWLFIRPPWSPTGSCCKAVVFESMKQESLAWPDEDKRNKALAMLEESSKHGCLQSSFLLWDSTRKMAISDPGRYLQSLRTLRDYATKGCWEAQLALARACVSRNQLGLEQKGCSDLVSQIFQSSALNKPSKLNGVNNFMRYILVDWLVEVATMKDFSSLTLHITVSCVDRYLLVSCVDKTRLQLLGIACMVICTRYTSKEILTIREAVWLTDNTYKYEDLVRMMGEVISVLEGKIRDLTISVLSLHKKCFHDEVPKDNRSMSLTGVQQRFEDDSYQQISKEKVMAFSELCAILEVEEDILCKSEPPLANTKSAGDIHAFLTSPSSKNKRRKEEHIPEDRDNLLVTPTAELSAQEETLLGDFLDWSLSCSSSGYEGDQESETEEGDREGTTAHVTTLNSVFNHVISLLTGVVFHNEVFPHRRCSK
ncbi:CCNF protein, partial [Polypterus senegalus]|nr:CCNF protein [Polypterus senegalus]